MGFVALAVVRGSDSDNEARRTLQVVAELELSRVPARCQPLCEFRAALPWSSVDRRRLNQLEAWLTAYQGWRSQCLFVLDSVQLDQSSSIRVHSLFPEHDVLCQHIEFKMETLGRATESRW